MSAMTFLRPALVTAVILLFPLLAMLFGTETDLTVLNFVIAGGVLFATALAYEVVAKRRGKRAYRAAAGMAVVTALLLGWINGAVGLIGSEDNPANLLYGVVVLIGIMGAAIARLRSRGMAWALFVTAGAQALVPLVAWLIWQPDLSWGNADVWGVVALNTAFAMLFAGSGWLFRQAGRLPIAA